MEPIDFFRKNEQRAQKKMRALAGLINRFSWARLLVLLLGGWGLFQVVQSEQLTATIVVFFTIVFVFFFLVQRQSKLNIKKNELGSYIGVNNNEITAIQEPATNQYDDGSFYANDEHLYSSDLDVFGNSSLYHYLNRCATQRGRDLLAAWLTTINSRKHIITRQDFVRELTKKINWLQKFQTALFPLNKYANDPAEILKSFLEKPIQFPSLRWVSVYAILAPFLTLGLLILSIWNLKYLPYLISLGLINLGIGIFFSRTVGLIGARFNKVNEAFNHYVPAIRLIENGVWESERGISLARSLERTGIPISTSIQQLALILGRLDARLNQFVGAVLNIVMLWDIRQIVALENWQKTSSMGIYEAFDVVGEFESTGSLSGLMFRCPDWTMPEILDSDMPCVIGTEIGHPLIPKEKRICNSYSNDDHCIGLITGSNMAGKSTFLRTVGVNGVLAFCGGPVCAKMMKLSVFQWVTYMRIRDSVNEGTSTFMAELNRIEKVMELVQSDKKVFVLLDELLRGTNSTDKYLGSKAIITFLIKKGASGLLATHDLKLSEMEETYPGILKNYHFDIQVEGQEMVFDYKLKSGPCTIFNASLLLKKIGIDI